MHRWTQLQSSESLYVSCQTEQERLQGVKVNPKLVKFIKGGLSGFWLQRRLLQVLFLKY